MSDASIGTCDHPDCAAPAVRTCYFCPNACCEQHITTTNGAVCYACSEIEQKKRDEREQAAREAEARAKSSGCLGMLALVCVALGLAALASRSLLQARRTSEKTPR